MKERFDLRQTWISSVLFTTCIEQILVDYKNIDDGQ